MVLGIIHEMRLNNKENMGSDGDGMVMGRVSRVYVYTAMGSTRERLLADI